MNSFQCILEGRLYLANHELKSSASEFRYFTIPDTMQYNALCDDFGPMNVSSVLRFIDLVEDEMEFYAQKKLVHLVPRGRRPFTNGAFLIGAYLILKHNVEPDEVIRKFDAANLDLLEPFRDATFAPVRFGLDILDCLRAVSKGKSLGWLWPQAATGVWGAVDVDEYDHYEDPLNGDLVQVRGLSVLHLPASPFAASKPPTHMRAVPLKRTRVCVWARAGRAGQVRRLQGPGGPPRRRVLRCRRVPQVQPGLLPPHLRAPRRHHRGAAPRPPLSPPPSPDQARAQAHARTREGLGGGWTGAAAGGGERAKPDRMPAGGPEPSTCAAARRRGDGRDRGPGAGFRLIPSTGIRLSPQTPPPLSLSPRLRSRAGGGGA